MRFPITVLAAFHVYYQVRRMIDEQLCAGVRCVNGGALVSWFLTYPDGSMGMLFTIQVGLSYVSLLKQYLTTIRVFCRSTGARV
jgi:hypothetical protein